jgi:2-polyprenyl-3-methyl-5-hydroxy-6-metoxy-1,4-benzoquinol methylase
MGQQLNDLLEQVRQQYDFGPYPRIAIDKSPQEDLPRLFNHCVATGYYLRHRQVWQPEGKVILDAGCGTGYDALGLALANPGAKIVGIDLSGESVRLAQQRVEFHGITNAEFHQASIGEFAQSGMQFDYINCDEVLYIQADQVATLRQLKSLLKPQGIIRTNLHNQRQRFYYFQAQELFRYMGLMDGNPEELEIEIVQSIFQSLNDNVLLKNRIWAKRYEGEDAKEGILMNLLFQGDKGFTVPELFGMLEASELNFISMLDWRSWDLLSLFKDIEDLPAFLAMNYDAMTIADRLNIYDLLNPSHRLLDFWCDVEPECVREPLEDWSDAQWQNTTIHLHPVWKTATIRDQICDSIKHETSTVITKIFQAAAPPDIMIRLDSLMMASLLPLWDAPQPFDALLKRYMQVKPIDIITLEPVVESTARSELQTVIRILEQHMHVLVV